MIRLIFIFALLFVSALAFAQESDLEKEKRLSAEYLATMAKEKDARLMEGGVVIRPIFVSDKETYPSAESVVTVIYHLTGREGNLIEESLSSDEVISFPLNKLIKCWKSSLPVMSVGSLYKITCPSDTAYGDKGTSDGVIKGGAALTFRVTLLGVDVAESILTDLNSYLGHR